jgi:hypothetical protein
MLTDPPESRACGILARENPVMHPDLPRGELCRVGLSRAARGDAGDGVVAGDSDFEMG